VTDPASVGWAARLVGKLPTMRGIANWFYVSANWGRISEEHDTYRRQIKDREEWAERALGDQAQLHDLVQQRLSAELVAWQRMASDLVNQRDDAVAQRDNILAIADRVARSMDASMKLIEDRSTALTNACFLLGVLLSSEGPALQEAVLSRLDADSRQLVARVMADAIALSPPPQLPEQERRPSS
jgi:hypothetical protein